MQKQSTGLGSLMDGMISSDLPLKIRLLERSSAVGVATAGGHILCHSLVALFGS